MRRRARTAKQSFALAYGTMKYRNRNQKNLGFDMEQISRRNEAEKEIQAQGLEMCVWCRKGNEPDFEICQHCRKDRIPF